MSTGGLPSLAIGADNHLHATYYDFTHQFLKYSTCSGGCNLLANWSGTSISSPGIPGLYSSVVVEPGRLHVSYTTESPNNLYYASCQSGCTSAASWTRTVVDPGASAGAEHQMVQASTGRLHIAYLKVNTQDLNYATCAAACTIPANWRRGPLDAVPQVGAFPSIAINSLDRIGVAYLDLANLQVKFAE